jgi:hypothetical protein
MVELKQAQWSAVFVAFKVGLVVCFNVTILIYDDK